MGAPAGPPLRTGVLAALVLASVAAAPSAPPPQAEATVSPPAPAARPAVPPPLRLGPGYYRAVVFDGRAFPVARSTYLSLLEFGNNWHAPRMRLVGGRWLLVGRHEGIDITAEAGAPVLSMTGGVVEATGWTFYSGLRVGVRGQDGKYYLYAHLRSLAPGVVPGATVRAGDVLGSVGNTGYGQPGHRDEFPPHLHFGIQGPGGWENPYPLLARLYRATVRVQRAAEARLAALARSGHRAAWRRLAASLTLGAEEGA
ncbi:MAG TPA: M23 family metallopeptidase [Actinomycetota bacterium]|nr:M23 family metallopeptidase [Actinomycetota bacterium]